MNLYEIERYSANHPDWEGSFSERLYEYCEWDINEFWKLHKTLIDLAIFLRDQDFVDKRLMLEILGIQQSVQNMFSAHFSKRDVCNIKNISEEELREFMERFNIAILGVASGQVIPESSFDLKNPLILSTQLTHHSSGTR
jgi:Immunity protein 41